MLGIQFGTKHSWDDWGLILENVEETPPEPRRYVVEVPGRDGVLDLTGELTEEICYGPRMVTFTFHVKSGGWTALKSEIMSFLHGKTMNVMSDLDTEYFWRGFCLFDSFSSNETTGTLVIRVEADPYKYAKMATSYSQNGDGTVVCANNRMKVIPQITNTAEATIVFGTVSVTLSEGVHKVDDIVFAEGNNTLVITSTGLTTITYRQGRL